jgi:antitoxin (DNA-binding transcriptional repressor) of toxin-antitoxin stability system
VLEGATLKLYTVQAMKGYRVAEARARFGEILDEAEQGATVLIERHGVRFTLRAEPSPPRRKPTRSAIAWADRDVLSGQWTWDLSAKGLRFRSTKRRA